MESVRDQTDDQVVLGNGLIEGLVVRDVERGGGCVLDALCELFGGFNVATC
jgi:hypothetical protein